MSDRGSTSSSEARARAERRGPRPFPRALVRFVELVEEERFWDSHEVLEEPWRDSGSEFYHGLILFVSAFVHVQRDNAHGIEAQLRKALPCLEPHRPHYLGLDVDRLVEHVHRCLGIMQDRRSDPPGSWEAVLPFPSLTLDPAWVRGDEKELHQRG